MNRSKREQSVNNTYIILIKLKKIKHDASGRMKCKKIKKKIL